MESAWTPISNPCGRICRDLRVRQEDCSQSPAETDTRYHVRMSSRPPSILVACGKIIAETLAGRAAAVERTVIVASQTMAALKPLGRYQKRGKGLSAQSSVAESDLPEGVVAHPPEESEPCSGRPSPAPDRSWLLRSKGHRNGSAESARRDLVPTRLDCPDVCRRWSVPNRR